MFDRNKYIIGTIGILILAGIAGYLVWKDLSSQFANNENPSENNATSNNNETSATPISSNPNEKPVPALPFPVEIKTNLSVESRILAIETIKELIAFLRNVPSSPGHWVDLGLQRNLIGDYLGAIEAWEYAAYLRPDDFIPHHNIGDLYTYALNDYAKAEASYRESLRRDPTAIMVYQKLHEMYRFKMKDNVKAKAILEEGINKNPTTSEWLKKLLVEFEASI